MFVKKVPTTANLALIDQMAVVILMNKQSLILVATV